MVKDFSTLMIAKPTLRVMRCPLPVTTSMREIATRRARSTEFSTRHPTENVPTCPPRCIDLGAIARKLPRRRDGAEDGARESGSASTGRMAK